MTDTSEELKYGRKGPCIVFLVAFILALMQLAPWVSYSHVRPGEDLDLHLTITNNDPSLHSIDLHKEVFDPLGNSLIEDEETLSIGLGESNITTTLQIPLFIEEGWYTLKNTATNNESETFVSEFVFIVDKGLLYFSPNNIIIYILLIVGTLWFLMGAKKRRREKRKSKH